jgi:DNA-binding winged helix-turn-helix (wHTH) protein
VTKVELLDLVWPKTVDEEAALHVQVSALRKVLGADAITTVSDEDASWFELAEGSSI